MTHLDLDSIFRGNIDKTHGNIYNGILKNKNSCQFVFFTMFYCSMAVYNNEYTVIYINTVVIILV